MAEFKSRYSELGFYVDGSLRQLRNGRYITTDKKEIAVLKQIKDVTELVTAKKETEKKADEKGKEETPKGDGKKSEKPAAKGKKPAKAKTSDK